MFEYFHLYFTTPSLHAILFSVPPELSIVSGILSSSDGNYIMMNNGLLWTNIPQWHKHTHEQTESLWELVVSVHIWLIFKEVWLLILYSPCVTLVFSLFPFLSSASFVLREIFSWKTHKDNVPYSSAYTFFISTDFLFFFYFFCIYFMGIVIFFLCHKV